MTFIVDAIFIIEDTLAKYDKYGQITSHPSGDINDIKPVVVLY
jgi:hypothetical protein